MTRVCVYGMPSSAMLGVAWRDRGQRRLLMLLRLLVLVVLVAGGIRVETVVACG